MDTTTSYLGLRLPHPFIAGASPRGTNLDEIKRLEDAGCAAIVLHSLFEEQISLAEHGRIHHMDPIRDDFSVDLADFPEPHEFPFGPDRYAEHISRVKRAVRVPIIASLNGTSGESWLRFSRVIEQAGADALELNMYEVVTDFDMTSAAVEHQLVQVTGELKQTLKIPIAVKVSPFFAAFANVARRLDRAGADAIVMFNRFYQPDIDVKSISSAPRLELSTSAELLVRLRWLAILYGRVRPSLAATGGVATPADGIKALLAGADVVQLVSALLRHGPAYLSVMRQGLERWMEWHKVASLADVRGRVSLKRCTNPAVFERANYIRALQSWKA
jgi:dihydroorotate dehydrogenase (fumarate)